MGGLYDAVVVGMGPVGACMALALAREGLSVLVVEPSMEPFEKPRAIGIDHETLRLLQSFGIMEEFGPTLGDYRPSEYRSARGELLRRIIPQPEPHPQAWPPYSTFVQPELEAILRRACDREPLIELKLGWSAGPPTQQEERVEIEISDARSGCRELVSSRYLIGCDGARSPVRESLPVTLQDLEFDEQWLVVDVIVDDGAGLPDVTVQYCNAQRPATYIAGPGTLRRWEIMLLPGEDGEAMADEASVRRLLASWLREDQGRIWRAASYRFHALVADRWQCGRIFLAGDAVHQTPPFMAQGLNQGVKDVANLSWKIGAVLRGTAEPGILETYTEERRPNAAGVIELTKQLGKIICELDPYRAAARDSAMLEDVAAGRGEFVRQDLLPPLSPGRLVSGSDHLGRGGGKVFPQPFVKTDRGVCRLDDLMEGGFALFLACSVDEARLSFARAAHLEVVCLGDTTGAEAVREVEPVALRWLEQHGVAAALVRPDHIVFGTAATEADIIDLVGQLSSALATPSLSARCSGS